MGGRAAGLESRTMYQYDQIDQQLVDRAGCAVSRPDAAISRRSVVSEDDFRSLRLRNGLYIQRFAPMLRISVPYGLLSSRQVRMFARIAREYDKSYGHFTTRQNLQFNWPKLELVPDILDAAGERRDARDSDER